MSDILLMESGAGVIRLTLNRPEKRNALSHELLTHLDLALGKSLRPEPGSSSSARAARSFAPGTT